jgi:hypothetical protein
MYIQGAITKSPLSKIAQSLLIIVFSDPKQPTAFTFLMSAQQQIKIIEHELGEEGSLDHPQWPVRKKECHRCC